MALTGGIACGKSAVAGWWRQWGAETLDADGVAHRLLAPGGAVVGDVAAAFGPGVRAPDGGIDRAALGRIVFGDSDARRRLEALVHPAVIRRMREWAAQIRRDGRFGVAVIPLLFEAGLEKDWDAVICVASGEQAMLERLAGRGLTPEEAKARIASQWPVSEKTARADHVIENNGSLAELESKSRALWNHLMEQGD
ncbi:MAG: dephospho-CoA kinase [Lentisphaerae bacterium]|mgnify:CR=1 FL=1|nr:dephospho-CoA kinase [Lentisphaerota bacterium]